MQKNGAPTHTKMLQGPKAEKAIYRRTKTSRRRGRGPRVYAHGLEVRNDSDHYV